jgi:hypothetical protein
MSNPENDSRLEQLSREAADRYTVKASPSWDKMERELDKILPTEKKKKRPFLFWWIIPGLLMIVSILWYTMHTQAVDQASTASVTQQNSTHKEPNTDNSIQPILEKEKTASIPLISDAKLPNKIFKGSKQKQPSSYKAITASAIEQQEKIPSSFKNAQPSSAIASIQKDTIIAAANTASSSTDNKEIIGLPIDTGNNVTDSSIHTAKDSTPVSIMNVQEPITISTKDSIASKNKKEKAVFSWAVVAGIDATTVKFRYTDRASLSGGVLIGYHFNRHWSIHTGGLYTRKNYKMAGNDFKAPTGSWVANYKLETVDGFCTMWEIPLLARYTFDTKKKTRAFISGGLSSYLMTRENYNYFYYFNGSPVRRNANYPDGKTHPFSILKLSAGWIRETHKSSSLVVEPFANLPLSGLGFGSAKLSSFGIYFSYQFRQPNKKK